MTFYLKRDKEWHTFLEVVITYNNEWRREPTILWLGKDFAEGNKNLQSRRILRHVKVTDWNGLVWTR